MVYKVKILDVGIDDQFKFGKAIPIIYLYCQVIDEEFVKKSNNNGVITLSLDAWNFSFPSGADISQSMNELANAFRCHKDKIINLDVNENNITQGPSIFNNKDRKNFMDEYNDIL